MKLLKAAYTNNWESLNELASKEQLEPLELRPTEEAVVIARMKKLAKDPAVEPANALELVHMSYAEQEWERQSTIGDLVRPTPADRKAWAQYEKFIQLAVELLSKYRGIDGAWRSNRYDTVPTNDRSSMASMAAAAVKESFVARWNSAKDLNLAADLFEANEVTYGIDGLFECADIFDVIQRVVGDIESKGYVAMEECIDEKSYIIHIHDSEANEIDTVSITIN
ncbi:MAG: hypothetical protein JXR12_05620 [Neptunomonas phycophila]|uniref:hypothetical protein n=1 Tax=Neptunomonas phycophila TaxID=1572645 RepID=UPI003B8C2BE7